jgi:hypothetical protein
MSVRFLPFAALLLVLDPPLVLVLLLLLLPHAAANMASATPADSRPIRVSGGQVLRL